MIDEWLASYQARNTEESVAALCEIMQEIALAGLSRTDFFERAAFYGGTALRIFHSLGRFSEDLDFSLLERDPNFSLAPYLASIVDEFAALGLVVSIQQKANKQASAIESAFLKSDTYWHELALQGVLPGHRLAQSKSIKIKIEVDTLPPLGFATEEKLLLRPFSFYVKCFTLPSLFAGKLHALLFRKWKDRVKGRDWYDLEWYIQRGIPLDVAHFLSRAKDTRDWALEAISPDQIRELLHQKIETVAIDRILDDVLPFVKDDTNLKLWSAPYFLDLVAHLKMK
jgi:predicted nucleotidyltransferase component of viral defense system